LLCALALLAALPLGIHAVGCTKLPDGPPDLTSNAPDLAQKPDMAMLTPSQRGKLVVTMYGCANCHTPDDMTNGILAGQTMKARKGAYAANLTPDHATGIGDWTDDQIIRAVRTGVDDQDMPLCSSMPRFAAMTDAQAADLVAYLHSIPAVNHQIPDSMCTDNMQVDGGTGDAH
jgi:mono/diheme cytochrome c family protein